MTRPALAPARVATTAPLGAATGPARRQRQITLGLIATVVAVDQTTKWWAWRNAPMAIINPGGTWLIGRPVSGLLSGPVSGPLIDLLNVGLLTLAGLLLVSRPRRTLSLVTGALMIAGWSSNLLDRLGMHAVTAPGSVRGAVDFISLGPPYWNVADFVILGATALFIVAACTRGDRTDRTVAARRTPAAPSRPRAWVAAVGVVVAVVLSVPAAVHAGSGIGADPSRQLLNSHHEHV